MVGPKMQGFCHDHAMLKGNRCILRIRGAPDRQKLGMILENQLWSLKVRFLTNHNSSKDCLKTISFEQVDSWAKILHFRTHHL